MTAVEWLIKEIQSFGVDTKFLNGIIEQAKEIEKQQIMDAIEHHIDLFKETEISDEEIIKGIYKNFVQIGRIKFKSELDEQIEGAKWYREQLKKK